MTKNRRKNSPAETALAPENYDDLNREFYAMKPHEHFRYKAWNLAASTTFTGELMELGADGARIGSLSIRIAEPDTGVEGIVIPADDETLRDFVTTESEILLHQVAECLARLYLAHIDGQHCPWLEVARLQYGYKEIVEQRVQGDHVLPPQSGDLTAGRAATRTASGRLRWMRRTPARPRPSTANGRPGIASAWAGPQHRRGSARAAGFSKRFSRTRIPAMSATSPI